MQVLSQLSGKPSISFTRALAISSFLCVLSLVPLLRALGMPLMPMFLSAGAATLLWLVFRHPTGSLGLFLSFIPVYTLAFLLAKFFGPRYIGMLEGSDRVVLLLLVFSLLLRNGIKFTTPDWLLLSCFGLALIRLAVSGTLIGVLADFNFMIAYAAGRVTVLREEQEKRWARRAVWIVAILSVIGMLEVFVIGEGPRTLLYLSVANGGTDGLSLDAAFHADQYLGLRESATMFGPLQFAPLCMTGLVVWWVFCRDSVPAIMIVAGLICSLTRSAWLGTAFAISSLTVMMGQGKRLVQYGSAALILFLAAIPILGLGDYLMSNKSGEDPSAQGHRASILEGVQFMAEHPFGVGPGNASRFAVKTESNAFAVENSYLTFAAEYGIADVLLFIGFLVVALRIAWRLRTPVACVAVGVVIGFSTVMMFASLHDVFPLACWLWFPVGLTVRSAVERRASQAPL